ncbi:MAG: DEAD/DEAH box helicase [Ancrocorticia sp.]|uniref:DEAD/DEAH box helicase n=1 Tax=Ancrocorticia sp. TaxID=2593684 RepID=UPI003F8EA35E
MTDLLTALNRHALPGQIAGTIERPARESRTTPWPKWVHPDLLTALASSGATEAWIHQARAAECVHEGRHVVLASGTGSGKSFAAWVPILSDLLSFSTERVSLASLRHRPTALYLSPTKALAADQMAALDALISMTGSHIGVATADGDSDLPERSYARDNADIVLTNPDFAHHVMLSGQARWARLWRGLRLIVVDEFHNYKGLFGAHVGHVVRRILRLAAHYGAHPSVIFLSATSGDPAGAASRFLGESFGPVEAVTEDGSPRAGSTIVLWRPARIEKNDDDGFAPPPARFDGRVDDDQWLTTPIDAAWPAQPASVPEHVEPADAPMEDDAPRRAANSEAGDLTAFLVEQGARLLTFVRSRPGTERVAEIAQERLELSASHLAGTVAAYRGGYLPEERRELEAKLRTGDVRALATTSALELGIDISGLDAVVVTGWPGTHASFSQQIGRAGRAGRPGLAVFIGRDNPLDQYLLDHPEVIADTPSEANVFDPANPGVLIPQICAAAAELPLQASDAAVFGLEGTELFGELANEGLLRSRPAGWFWNTTLGVGAHETVSLRGEGSTVSIVDTADGTVLGTVDSSRADTTVFPGAIYLHQGVPFEVEELGEEVALVHQHRDEELRTFAREETSVEILDTDESVQLATGVWARGSVVVSSRVVGYDIRRARDGMYLGMVPLVMPVRQLRTRATWWTMSAAAIKESGVPTADLPGALHGAEHASIGILPLFATCDRWDLGGLSTAAHLDTGSATVIVHDAIEGGSGCSERGFEAGVDWINATLETIATCPCVSGCPRCVQSPKCGNNNSPLSKRGAQDLLTVLVRSMREARSQGLLGPGTSQS